MEMCSEVLDLNDEPHLIGYGCVGVVRGDGLGYPRCLAIRYVYQLLWEGLRRRGRGWRQEVGGWVVFDCLLMFHHPVPWCWAGLAVDDRCTSWGSVLGGILDIEVCSSN